MFQFLMRVKGMIVSDLRWPTFPLSLVISSLTHLKIVSEYDQEITQSQTAVKPMAFTTIMRYKEDKQSKTTSSLFPIEMIAKLE